MNRINLDENKNENLYGSEPQVIGYDGNNNPIMGYPTQPQNQLLGYDANGNPIYGQPVQQSQPMQQYQPVQQVQQYQQAQQPLQGYGNFMEAMRPDANTGIGISNATTSKDIEEIKKNIDKHKLALKQSPEVHALLSEVDFRDGSSIANFGQKASVEVSKVSDDILSKVRSLDDVGVASVLKDLNVIMKDFDIDKLNKEPSILSKLFGGNPIDKIFTKYETMSEKVDKIALTLAGYEVDIANDVKSLQKLREANAIYYNELEKHIVAGELACEQINQAYHEAKAIADETNATQDVERVTLLKMAYDMMEKRTLDLRTAEAIALGSTPVINQLTMGYFNLMTTLKGTLIVSLPAFKTGLCEAVSARKTQSIKENIDAVNENVANLITKYSKQTAEVNVQLIKNTSQGIIPADKLQEYVNNIMNGAKEVEKAQLEVATSRENSSRQLEDIKVKLIASNTSAPLLDAKKKQGQLSDSNNFKVK